jgi:predicted RND superfamily exporter protein
MKKSFYARYSWLILASIVIVFPYLLYNAKLAVDSNTNKVGDWIPATFTETGELKWFREHFVGDQFVIVTWDGCRLGGDASQENAEPDDPRIERLAETLVPADPNSPNVAKYGKYFKSVNTARRVLNRITAPPSSVPYDQAVERLKGALLGPDGRHTAVVVNLTDESVKDFRSAIGRGSHGFLVREHEQGALYDALQDCGLDQAQVHVGGPPIDNVSIDEEGDRTMARMVALAACFGMGLAWFSLRSIKLTLIVLACGFLSAITGLAFVNISGGKTDAVVLSMPSLLYILAISGAIHLINYYREELTEHGVEGAPGRAIRHGWRPTTFCNVTTAIGLGSLYAAEIVPIRNFGVYSAWGVMGMLVVLFLYLPAALHYWPMQRSPKPVQENHKPSGIDEWLDAAWLRFGRWVIRYHYGVAVACLLSLAFVGYGLAHMRTNIDLMKLFHPEARILKDYMYLEKSLGKLVPMEIVLRFTPRAQAIKDAPVSADRHHQLSFLERMESVNMVQKAIEQQFGEEGAGVVGRSMSAVTFAPTIVSEGESLSQFARRSGLNSRLESSRREFETSGFFQVDPHSHEELWRISLRVAAFENVDYGTFVKDIQQTVEPVVGAHEARAEVLNRIVAKRQSERYAGANVFIWNRSDEAEPAAGTHFAPPRDRIFTDALKTLLSRARLRVTSTVADPATVPVTQIERLRDYDCVVLAGAFSNADVQMIERRGGNVVDARRILTSQLETVPVRDANGMRPAAAGIAAVYTGVVPIVYKAQRTLLDSLISSSFWSFVTITPLMWFVSRSVAAGSVAMLPNILPILIVFGGMGWLDFAVDIGCMMSASIALGVAVDDTIHFMTWFRDDLDRTGDRRSAILAAFRRCATPTTQAALVNGLGLSVFATSTFMPTRKFGWLMLVILIAGLIAELVMTPALLAGPLGAAFKPRRKTSKEKPVMEPEPQTIPLPTAIGTVLSLPTVPNAPHRPPATVTAHSGQRKSSSVRRERRTGA